jgi:hypothetical protein
MREKGEIGDKVRGKKVREKGKRGKESENRGKEGREK